MAYFDKYGVEFSDDRKALTNCPHDFEGAYSIPNGVVEIGDLAFGGCVGLTNVEIPNSVKKIGKMAFSGRRKLTSIVIPNGVTEIGSSAFENCTGLRSIEIPESVEEIGMGAFSGCENLNNISIHKNVKSIGKFAFADIGPSLFINVDGENAHYCSDESGSLYSKDKSLLIHACNRVTNNLIIPEGVKKINSTAFQWSYFNMVSLPSSLEEIEAEAFLNASIRKIYTHHKRPSDIVVGNDAFKECAEFCTLYIPKDADDTALNWHQEFKKFRMILFWNVGQYW